MSDLLAAIQNEVDGFVTRYMVIAEVAGTHDMSERQMHFISADGLGNGGPATWDQIGMLRYAELMITRDLGEVDEH